MKWITLEKAGIVIGMSAAVATGISLVGAGGDKIFTRIKNERVHDLSDNLYKEATWLTTDQGSGEGLSAG